MITADRAERYYALVRPYTASPALEIGAGDGALSRLLRADSIAVTATDTGTLDIEDYGIVTTKRYATVIMMHVIEHLWLDPIQALENVNTLLEPGGRLILETPNAGYYGTRFQATLNRKGTGGDIIKAIERKRRTGYYGHVRVYTPGELKRMLAYAGFAIDVFRFTDAYHLKPSEGVHHIDRLFRWWPGMRRNMFCVARMTTNDLRGRHNQ